jgi:hypothetical protein
VKQPTLVVRLLVALLVVLPITFLLIAGVAGTEADGPLYRRFLNVAVFFLVLGPALAVVFAVLHLLLERRLSPTNRLGSILLGVAIGSLIVLPLVLERSRWGGILFGAFAGGLYALLINAPALSRSAHVPKRQM